MKYRNPRRFSWGARKLKGGSKQSTRTLGDSVRECGSLKGIRSKVPEPYEIKLVNDEAKRGSEAKYRNPRRFRLGARKLKGDPKQSTGTLEDSVGE